MAIADAKLKNFFSKQKIGTFDALKQGGKVEKLPEGEVTPDGNQFDSIGKKKSPESLPQIFETDGNISEQKQSQPQIQPSQISVSEPLANHSLYVSKPTANHREKESKPLANHQRTVSKPLAKPLAINDQKRELLNSNLRLNLYSISEQKLLYFIFIECRSNGTLTTRLISTTELLETLHIDALRLRNLIFRILNKGGLKIILSKAGRQACRVFELTKELYQCFSEEADKSILVKHQSLAKPLAFSSNSNSNSNNINTITNLDDEWKKINFEPLRDIGFSESQLKQLVGKNIPLVVQESINHFAFGLEHNPKTKQYQDGKDPLYILMGVLRKGHSWIEKNYKSANEMALDRILKERESQQQREAELRDKLMALEFNTWFSNLSDNEIDNMTTPEIPNKSTLTESILKNTQRGILLKYFRESVWPKLNSNDLMLNTEEQG